MDSSLSILDQQKDYYRARAAEYDEWFLRQGRYDRGAEWNQQWFNEVEVVREALVAFAPTGHVLELAAGTGWWTQELLKHTNRLTAVDAVAETLVINRERVGENRVQYVQADLFAWQPEPIYDVVFFSFWLSHVPPERFASFWAMVRSALRPGGRVFFVDSLRSETSTASNHQLPAPDEITQVRRLNDGQTFEIVKIFYDPTRLAATLSGLGWRANVQATPNYFLYGMCELV